MDAVCLHYRRMSVPLEVNAVGWRLAHMRSNAVLRGEVGLLWHAHILQKFHVPVQRRRKNMCVFSKAEFSFQGEGAQPFLSWKPY